jgi:hypothetical protein
VREKAKERCEIVTKERYVSFLDILGFSEIVRNTDLESLIKRFKAILFFKPYVEALGRWNNLEGKIQPANRKCSCFSFSDTFVLSTDDASIESFNDITIATFLLARSLFGLGFPVRGAITKGEADYIPGTNHLIGKALIDAAELEKKQDWFGVILSPDILSAQDTLPQDPIGDILIKYSVPFNHRSPRTVAFIVII